jgi:hypothetical protein
MLCLQSRDINHHLQHQKLRSEFRNLTRKIKRSDSDTFVNHQNSILDLHKRSFRMFKNLRLDIHHNIHTKPVSKEDWKNH